MVLNDIFAAANMPLYLILKPCQSGKTFLLIEQILDIFRANGYNRTINVVFCDNSLLQTVQAKCRIDTKDGLQFYRDQQGNVSLIVSSKSTVRSRADLYYHIGVHKIRNIICCNNVTQMKNITGIIDDFKSENYDFHLWVDEADKFKANKKFVQRWMECSNVKKITMMTATPEPILKAYDEIRVIPLNEAINPEFYHKFSECRFEFWNSELDPVPYAEMVLNAIKGTLNKGDVVFCPADVAKASHDDMTELLFKSGFDCVFKINGDHKKLLMRGGKQFDVSVMIGENGKKVVETEEMSVWISNMYEKLGLKQMLVGITGHLCVGRGITLVSEKMAISHAIIPHIKDKNNRYQLAGRLCGNAKQFSNYVVPLVYCNQTTHASICEMENKAISIPERAFQTQEDLITLQDYKHAHKEVIVAKFSLDDLLDNASKKMEVENFIKSHVPNAKPRLVHHLTGDRKTNGFYKSVLRDVEGVISTHTIDTQKYSGLNSNNPYRINIAYTNVNDKTSGVVYVRIMSQS